MASYMPCKLTELCAQSQGLVLSAGDFRARPSLWLPRVMLELLRLYPGSYKEVILPFLSAALLQDAVTHIVLPG